MKILFGRFLVIIGLVYSFQVEANEVKKVDNLEIKVVDLIEHTCKNYSLYINTDICIKEMRNCIDMEYYAKNQNSYKALEAFNECNDLQSKE